MARRIVHDDVNVEIGRDMLFDGVEEAAELLRPVARQPDNTSRRRAPLL
jgi:hypothetical protein